MSYLYPNEGRERPLDPPESKADEFFCEHDVPWDENCADCDAEIELYEKEEDGE